MDGTKTERLSRAIDALTRGRAIVVRSGADRGDVVLGARAITAGDVNFLVRHARGLVSLAISAERSDRLRLRPMASSFDGRASSAARSIEARRGITTGISAAERAHTLRTAAAEDAVADDLVSPGHVFPLRARPGDASTAGAAVALAVRAGLGDAATVCTILDDDGDVAGGRALDAFVVRHGLVDLAIHEIPVLSALRPEVVGTSRGASWH